MTGVIIAGGYGRRMEHLTGGHNKHSYEVVDRPMIMYPIENLKSMGCNSAVIVTSPEGMEDLASLDYGMDVVFKVQPEVKGSADAIRYAEGEVSGVFPVLCGDVYFGPHLPKANKPTLFWNEYQNANQHTVWNPETNELVEKPIRDIGKRAIVAYYYDERVFDVIKQLKPSDRGELELIDLHKYYLENGAEMVEHKGFFGDMGTPKGIERVSKHIIRFYELSR